MAVDERGFDCTRTHIGIAGAIQANAETVLRLAVLGEATLAPLGISGEIRSDLVFGAGDPMHTDSVGRESVQAVFVTDHVPVGYRALVLAHAARAAGHLRRGEQNGGADEDEATKCVHGTADCRHLPPRSKREIATGNHPNATGQTPSRHHSAKLDCVPRSSCKGAAPLSFFLLRSPEGPWPQPAHPCDPSRHQISGAIGGRCSSPCEGLHRPVVQPDTMQGQRRGGSPRRPAR